MDNSESTPEAHIEHQGDFNQTLSRWEEYLLSADDESVTSIKQQVIDELDELHPYKGQLCWVAGEGYSFSSVDDRGGSLPLRSFDGVALASIGVGLECFDGTWRIYQMFQTTPEARPYGLPGQYYPQVTSYRWLDPYKISVIPIQEIEDNFQPPANHASTSSSGPNSLDSCLHDESTMLAEMLSRLEFHGLSHSEQIRRLSSYVARVCMTYPIVDTTLAVTCDKFYVCKPDSSLIDPARGLTSGVRIREHQVPNRLRSIKGTCAGVDTLENTFIAGRRVTSKTDLFNPDDGLCVAIDPEEADRNALGLIPNQLIHIPLSSQNAHIEHR